MSLKASMRMKSDELFSRWITEHDVMKYMRECLVKIKSNAELGAPPASLGVRASTCVFSSGGASGSSNLANGGSSSRTNASRQRPAQSPRASDSQFPILPFTAPLAPPSSPRSPRKQASHSQHVSVTTASPSNAAQDDDRPVSTC